MRQLSGASPSPLFNSTQYAGNDFLSNSELIIDHGHACAWPTCLTVEMETGPRAQKKKENRRVTSVALRHTGSTFVREMPTATVPPVGYVFPNGRAKKVLPLPIHQVTVGLTAGWLLPSRSR